MSVPRFTVLLAVALVLTAPQVQASDLFTHRATTQRALQALGWTDEDAIEAVVAYNQAADLARLPGPARLATNLVFGPLRCLANEGEA
jgi:hypothetical protein